MSGPTRITMRHIAEAAGVSTMTVSLALRNHSRISAQTRARVQSIAARLGYRPHPYLSALMANLKTTRNRKDGANATLGFIYNYPRPSLATHPFFKSVLEGITRRAHQLGYGLDMFYSYEAGQRSGSLDRMLKARGIRGVIVGPTRGTNARLDYELDWQHFALATFGFSLREPGLHRASGFTYQAARLAYRELWDRGYRRIGLVNTRIMHYRVDGNWRAGHFEAQTERLGGVDPASVLLMEEGDGKAIVSWVGKFKPDAILTNTGSEIEHLRPAGYMVPRDIGIATLSPLLPTSDPFFAGVDQREEAIGAATTDIVVEQLNTNTFGLPAVPKSVMIECTWRDGRSIRAPLRSLGKV